MHWAFKCHIGITLIEATVLHRKKQNNWYPLVFKI